MGRWMLINEWMIEKRRHIHFQYSWTMSIQNNLMTLSDLLLQYRTVSRHNINQTIIILSLNVVWILLILTWDTYEGENKKYMSEVNNVTCNIQQTHLSCLRVHFGQWMPSRQWGKNVDYAASLITSLCFNVTTYIVHTNLHHFSFPCCSQHSIRDEVSVPIRSAPWHTQHSHHPMPPSLPHATFIFDC
jgi:hypothetical protein